MNSVERCLAAIGLREPDRVPIVPLIISHAAKMCGVRFSDYNHDPKIIVDCQAAAWKRYGYDGIHVTTDNWILPQALGVPVQFYPDLPPTGMARPLAQTKDLATLPRVAEAKNAARMGLLPAATRYARQILANECFVKTNFDQGPFSLASAVRGIDNLMVDLRDDEQFVFDLLGICTEMVFELGKAVGAAGAHAITLCKPAWKGIWTRQACSCTARRISSMARAWNSSRPPAPEADSSSARDARWRATRLRRTSTQWYGRPPIIRMRDSWEGIRA